MSNLYPHLLSPGRIGSMELKNRIAVTAMGVSLSEDDGTVGEQLIGKRPAGRKWVPDWLNGCASVVGRWISHLAVWAYPTFPTLGSTA